MNRAIINVGLFLFFAFSLPLIIVYIYALQDKITRPGFKNMNDRELIWFDLLALVFAVLDFLILRRFIRALRK